MRTGHTRTQTQQCRSPGQPPEVGALSVGTGGGRSEDTPPTVALYRVGDQVINRTYTEPFNVTSLRQSFKDAPKSDRQMTVTVNISRLGAFPCKPVAKNAVPKA